MTRETEVATYLRTDTTLLALVPGKIYAYGQLTAAGITDATLTPSVWTGGTFKSAIVVRQRAPVPTGDLQGVVSKRTSTSQAIEVWGYATSQAAVEAILAQVYRLMMGKRLAAAFSATWAGSAPGITQAPELPSGIFTYHEDYRIVFLRRAVTV